MVILFFKMDLCNQSDKMDRKISSKGAYPKVQGRKTAGIEVLNAQPMWPFEADRDLIR